MDSGMSHQTMTADTEPAVVTTRINRDLCRFEAYKDGVAAGFVHYQMRSGQICFTLTHLTQDFRNYRFAAELFQNVLHEAEVRELEVLPFCPLMRYFIATHFEYVPLVPADQRGQFNLAHPDDVKQSKPEFGFWNRTIPSRHQRSEA